MNFHQLQFSLLVTISFVIVVCVLRVQNGSSEERVQPTDTVPQRSPVEWGVRSEPLFDRSYFVLLSSIEYLPGVYALLCRLDSFGNDIPVMLVVDDSVDSGTRSTIVTIMEKLTLHVYVTYQPTVLRRESPEWREKRKATYTKLRVWEMDWFAEKGVYIDADAVPWRDPVLLFDYLSSESTFCVCGNSQYFNSGLFAFYPNKDRFQEITSTLYSGAFRKNMKDGPTEQDVLIQVFGPRKTTTFLPGVYNFRKVRVRHIPANAVVVHFIGSPKPWSTTLSREKVSLPAFTHFRKWLQLAQAWKCRS
eukprot:gb/GECG01010900.1/.p1 GENE.gb/GECG01010900.1/~~gb/GECG01010900.1/.p1  ORF type:complete len:305 (+),score=14.83 gb/GECG01010900.1/:1-915(+)